MAISNTTPLTGSGFQNAATGATSSASTVSGTTSSIANNFDQFLTLLTTQLKNQSPLDPLDTNQFTAQLVQFAGVEQQLRTNETLGALLNLSKATTTTNAVSFVGSTITADGAATQLKNGSADWKINMPRAGSATITIKSANGSVVQTLTTALSAGDQTYRWDGATSTGSRAPDGEYVITVDAKDASAQQMTAKTEIAGIVTGVDLSGDTPMLQIGTLRVAIDKVKSVVKSN